jgi:hypothetical protein
VFLAGLGLEECEPEFVATPKTEMELVKSRLRRAKELHELREKQNG